MTAPTPPAAATPADRLLAVYDVHNDDWRTFQRTPTVWRRFLDWAADHGIKATRVHRIEIRNTPTRQIARVLSYRVDEYGRVFCTLPHDHLGGDCEFRAQPYDVALHSYPPRIELPDMFTWAAERRAGRSREMHAAWLRYRQMILRYRWPRAAAVKSTYCRRSRRR